MKILKAKNRYHQEVYIIPDSIDVFRAHENKGNVTVVSYKDEEYTVDIEIIDLLNQIYPEAEVISSIDPSFAEQVLKEATR
jgi:hypothetical protein